MEKVIYKIVLLGTTGVGKTALVIRYIDNRFQSDYKATLGFDIFVKKFSEKGITYSLALWDLAGQEKLDVLRKSYLEGSQGAILVYDVTNRDSFNKIHEYLNELTSIEGKVPYILVGNKVDLVKKIKISTDEGKALANQINSVNFYETSAKTGQKVNNIFEEISRAVHREVSNPK